MSVRSLLLVVVALAAGCGGGSGDSERQEEVADRGSRVMSFDLDATTHVFEERADGGVQTVVADDPEDSAEIAEIRRHLRAEVEAFARGDFRDPAEVHGGRMPGLQELEAGADRLEIAYDDVPNGGRITYVARDEELVAALHTWFEAQVSDHGPHAEAGR